jgi:hypothetical protein
MPWQSESGQFWGQEVLSSVTPDLYLSRGFAFLKDRKAYSWAVRMTRIGGGAPHGGAAGGDAPEGGDGGGGA